MLLGVFGSGGSIITMPALLYLLDVEPKPAIAMSLGIVAITATITALQHWRHGNVNLKITAIFGLFGVRVPMLGLVECCDTWMDTVMTFSTGVLLFMVLR